MPKPGFLNILNYCVTPVCFPETGIRAASATPLKRELRSMPLRCMPLRCRIPSFPNRIRSFNPSNQTFNPPSLRGPQAFNPPFLIKNPILTHETAARGSEYCIPNYRTYQPQKIRFHTGIRSQPLSHTHPQQPRPGLQRGQRWSSHRGVGLWDIYRYFHTSACVLLHTFYCYLMLLYKQLGLTRYPWPGI
jgi:hypothetical protein